MRLDVLIVQMLVSNLYEVYMMIFCYELHYIHIFLYCILFMRCELYDKVSVLPYHDHRPWLPGTLFSALFPCLVQESWAVVTFGIKALVNRF